MLRKFGIIAVLSLLVTALAAVPVLAQSGHFITGGGNAPVVSAPNEDSPDLDISGRVAGLGGTTFEIFATADATADYACQNRGGEFPNDPQKQSVSAIVDDSTGVQRTPRNGSARFSLSLEPPESTFDCPGGQTDVLTAITYSDVTVFLEEDGATSDTLSLGEFSFTYFEDVP